MKRRNPPEIVYTIQDVITPSGSYDGFKVTASLKNGDEVGWIWTDWRQKNHFVGHSGVKEQYRGIGIGVMLYEIAGEEACRRGKPLISEGTSRSHFAGRVWSSLGRRKKAKAKDWDGIRDWEYLC